MPFKMKLLWSVAAAAFCAAGTLSRELQSTSFDSMHDSLHEIAMEDFVSMGDAAVERVGSTAGRALLSEMVMPTATVTPGYEPPDLDREGEKKGRGKETREGMKEENEGMKKLGGKYRGGMKERVDRKERGDRKERRDRKERGGKRRGGRRRGSMRKRGGMKKRGGKRRGGMKMPRGKKKGGTGPWGPKRGGKEKRGEGKYNEDDRKASPESEMYGVMPFKDEPSYRKTGGVKAHPEALDLPEEPEIPEKLDGEEDFEPGMAQPIEKRERSKRYREEGMHEGYKSGDVQPKGKRERSKRMRKKGGPDGYEAGDEQPSGKRERSKRYHRKGEPGEGEDEYKK